VLYAVANNFFPIVAQRYNRPRIRRYLELARRDQHRQPVIFEQQAAAVQ